MLRIEVADSGKGIPLDKQEEIFREFHQLDNPERDRTKGLGLGLAIVDRLAKLLNHRIGVMSSPSAGSTFHIVISRGDTAAAKPLNAPSIESGADLSGMVVLVIDDEVNIREGMNTLLSQWGCELILAGSEDEAVELLRQSGGVVPDVVIADYRLREEKTGIQAIRRIHAECGINIPAVIIAGDTAPERLREVAASGFPLFHKPVTPSQLRAFLHQSASPY
jgi:CheY-like chemotaxis protein